MEQRSEVPEATPPGSGRGWGSAEFSAPRSLVPRNPRLARGTAGERTAEGVLEETPAQPVPQRWRGLPGGTDLSGPVPLGVAPRGARFAPAGAGARALCSRPGLEETRAQRPPLAAHWPLRPAASGEWTPAARVRAPAPLVLGTGPAGSYCSHVIRSGSGGEAVRGTGSAALLRGSLPWRPELISRGDHDGVPESQKSCSMDRTGAACVSRITGSSPF
nr:uncharacterized protein LOC125638044 [Caretta caretta]